MPSPYSGKEPLDPRAICLVLPPELFSQQILLVADSPHERERQYHHGSDGGEPGMEQYRCGHVHNEGAQIAGMPHDPVRATSYDGMVLLDGNVHGEKIPEGEDRPRKAIEVARRFAKGEATEEELAAARSAAWDAAWKAAWTAQCKIIRTYFPECPEIVLPKVIKPKEWIA